ncbi:hypothetical protein ACFWNK_12000 [Streptomyces sp. NPDC058417]|uniref:hypothetical protein n=1 Tax=unclassified Streptomyces TaxID=2593676 RepID=UPI003664E4DB
MTIDPSDPETFTDALDGTGGVTDPTEIGVEAPEDDAAEQRTEVATERDDPLEGLDPARADEADLIEQARVVAPAEDDRR